MRTSAAHSSASFLTELSKNNITVPNSNSPIVLYNGCQYIGEIVIIKTWFEKVKFGCLKTDLPMLESLINSSYKIYGISQTVPGGSKFKPPLFK